jgi:hypothetical protein
MISFDILRLNEPGNAEEALEHLVAEHGWQGTVPDPMMLTAHVFAHGGAGRPDLADGQLTHQHIPAVASISVPVEPPRPWAYIPTTAAGIGLMAVGLLLPWISAVAPLISQVGRSGLDTGDGKLIAAGLVVMSLVLGSEHISPRRTNRAWLLTLAAGIGAAIWFDWHDLLQRGNDLNLSDSVHVNVGAGLYLCVLGVSLTAIGIVMRAHALAPGALLADLERYWEALAAALQPHRKQVAAAAAVLILITVGAVTWNRVNAHSPMKDVTIGTCNDGPSVSVVITNRTSATSDYSVTVSLTDKSNTEVGQGTATATNLTSGESRTEWASFSNHDQHFTSCEVANVTRDKS